MIWRMPGLAAVVIVSLGVGIGVNTAVFSWIQAMVLQPIPGVADAGGVQLVEPRADTGSYPGASWLEYRDLRDRSCARFPICSRIRMVPFNVGETGRPERTHGLLVSGNYFSALGLRPALGRFLRPDEAARAGGAPVVVISHAYWQNALRRRADRARTDAARERSSADHRRRHARAVSGHGHDAGLRFLGAGDDGAGAAGRIARARGSRPARLLRGRPAGAAREHAPRRRPSSTRSMRQLAHDYPETNKTMLAEVLPFWQAPRGPQQFLVSALASPAGASCCSCCSRSAATPPT